MAKKIKGVTCITRNGSTYWYARVDGRRKYCGKDDKGKKLAEIARKKWEVRQYENREVSVGVKKKKSAFKTFNDLIGTLKGRRSSSRKSTSLNSARLSTFSNSSERENYRILIRMKLTATERNEKGRVPQAER